MAEMQNDPMPKGGLYFSIDDWQEAPRLPNHKRSQVDYYIAVDPAFGKGQRADYTAIMVVGIYRGNVYVVDGIYDDVVELL